MQSCEGRSDAVTGGHRWRQSIRQRRIEEMVLILYGTSKLLSIFKIIYSAWKLIKTEMQWVKIKLFLNNVS